MLLNCSAENEKSSKKKKKKARRRKRREAGGDVDVPPEIAAEPELAKYWAQRYRLFSRFDEGIKLDHGQFELCLIIRCTNFYIFQFSVK